MSTIATNTAFTTELTVTIDHINYGNHLSHDRLITMMHEARIRFFEALGHTEMAFYGVGLIMKSLTINYRQEVFRGEVLTFVITVNEIRNSAFSLDYDVVNERNESIGDSQIVLVGFDYETRKPARLTNECRQDLGGYSKRSL